MFKNFYIRPSESRKPFLWNLIIFWKLPNLSYIPASGLLETCFPFHAVASTRSPLGSISRTRGPSLVPFGTSETSPHGSSIYEKCRSSQPWSWPLATQQMLKTFKRCNKFNKLPTLLFFENVKNAKRSVSNGKCSSASAGGLVGLETLHRKKKTTKKKVLPVGPLFNPFILRSSQKILFKSSSC